MMVFEPASALPRQITSTDLKRLTRVLARTLPRQQGRPPRTIGLRFVSPLAIRRLNRAYRRLDRATDVLSFPCFQPSKPMVAARHEPWPLGDIVICPSYAAREARRRGIALREELVRLLVHGALHLVGFDHATEREETRMFSLQEHVVACVI